MQTEERRKRFASELEWTATGAPGVEKKLLVAGNESSTHDVSILRLEPGARLPSLHEGWGGSMSLTSVKSRNQAPTSVSDRPADSS